MKLFRGWEKVISVIHGSGLKRGRRGAYVRRWRQSNVVHDLVWWFSRDGKYLYEVERERKRK